MLHEIVMSGLGGQGALLIGQILAVAGTVEDLNATWMPTYGPEKRGGTAFCDVILSDEPIGSPVVDEPEAVVAMDAASFERFESSIAPGGKMIYNASVCTAAPARGYRLYRRSGRGDRTCAWQRQGDQHGAPWRTAGSIPNCAGDLCGSGLAREARRKKRKTAGHESGGDPPRRRLRETAKIRKIMVPGVGKPMPGTFYIGNRHRK